MKSQALICHFRWWSSFFSIEVFLFGLIATQGPGCFEPTISSSNMSQPGHCHQAWQLGWSWAFKSIAAWLQHDYSIWYIMWIHVNSSCKPAETDRLGVCRGLRGIAGIDFNRTKTNHDQRSMRNEVCRGLCWASEVRTWPSRRTRWTWSVPFCSYFSIELHWVYRTTATSSY